ncbi:hypothetical protein ACVSQB_39415, partial [Bradyrhizobium elkanii]
MVGDIKSERWARSFRNGGRHRAESADKRRQRERFYLALYILIMGNTGLRVGEARRLRWRDVSATKTLTDEVRAVLSVRGKTGEREVVCNRGVDRFLDELRAFRTEELDDAPGTDEHVFCHRTGGLIVSFKGGFQRALKEAGVLYASNGKKRVPYRKDFDFKVTCPAIWARQRAIAYWIGDRTQLVTKQEYLEAMRFERTRKVLNLRQAAS